MVQGLVTYLKWNNGEGGKWNIIENWNWGLCFGKSVLGLMTNMEYIRGEEEKLLKIETLGLCFGKLGLGSMTNIEYIGGQEEKVYKIIEN